MAPRTIQRKVVTKDLAAITPVLSDENSKYVFLKHRIASFSGGYVFDKESNASCTSKKLAEAGFFYTGESAKDPSAMCAFCLKEMEFELEDEPWEEHVNHCPDCELVKLGEPDETKWRVKDFVRLVAFRNARMKTRAARKLVEELDKAMEEIQELKMQQVKAVKK